MFLLFCFFSVNESTFETRKNVFHVTFKTLSVLEVFIFKNFRILDFMASSNAEV